MIKLAWTLMNMTSYLLKSLNLGLLVGITIYNLTAQAQPKLENNRNSLSEEIVFQTSLEPPGEPEPKDTKGSGSRDGMKCSNTEQNIKTLMPKLDMKMLNLGRDVHTGGGIALNVENCEGSLRVPGFFLL